MVFFPVRPASKTKERQIFGMNSAETASEKLCETGKNEAFRISKKRTLAELAVLAASGCAMTLAFAPANLAFFAWVAAVPLIWLCAGRRPARAFWYGLVWGCAWNLTGIFFLREIMWFIPYAFAVVLGLFCALFAVAIPGFFANLLYPAEIRKSDCETRRKFYAYPAWGEMLATFSLAGLWVLLEWVRSWIFTGFPWNLLGASQWKNFSLIQICEYTGVYGISFLVIFVNIAVYFAVHGLARSLPEGKYKRPFPLLTAIVLCIAACSLGVSAYNKTKRFYAIPENLIPFAVGAVQPDLSQRRDAGDNATWEALDVCRNLSLDLIQQEKSDAKARNFLRIPDRASAPAETDAATRNMLVPLQVIIWPETAVPIGFYLAGHPASDSYRREVRGMIRDFPLTKFLIGTLIVDRIREGDDGKMTGDFYNSALLLKAAEPDGKNAQYDKAGLYSKRHLVPYGEFVPLGDTFPALRKWIGMGRDLTPGPGFRPMEIVPQVNAGILICYEDVFAYAAREQARSGANLLLTVTNDAWFPTSSEPEQHYINSLFRAVETRLPLLRVGNSDFSVVVGPDGRLRDSIFKDTASDGTTVFHPEVRRRGAAKFVIDVPRQPRPTLYTLYGDWFVALCGAFFISGLTVVLLRHFLFARSLNDPFDAERRRMREAFLAGPGNKN